MSDKREQWPAAAYGCIIRGDETTSEDQIATAATPELALRIAACLNLLKNHSTQEILRGEVEVNHK